MAADFNKTKDKTDDVERRKSRLPQVFRKPKDGAQSGTPLFLRSPSAASRADGPEAENQAAAIGMAGNNADEQLVNLLGLIVEDSAGQVADGQMKRSEFLEKLRKAVSGEAEAALSGTLWSAVGCPWIDHWFGYYSTVDAQRIERTIRKYAPDASGATTANDLIPIISRRVRVAIEAWSTTGSTGDFPAESPASDMAAGGGEKGIFFKEREGATADSSDALESPGSLGSGASLDNRVRSGMESAYGEDFSDVRVHTDSSAAELSSGFGARAFTVGEHIAFAPGEYQPGSPIGDAIIAHELAHVAQQKGGGAADGPLQKNDEASTSLEEDADSAAVGAVVSMWTGIKGGMARIAQSAMPRLRSGLRLQRCGSSNESKSKPTYTTKVMEKGEILYPGKDSKDPKAGIVGTGQTAGRVEVRSGDVISEQKSPQSEATKGGNLFALEYSGPKASSAHWVQFAWIELRDFTKDTPLKGEVSTTAGKKSLTTGSAKPSWFLDGDPGSPYYESGGANLREPDKTTIFDRPGGMDSGAEGEVKRIASENDPKIDYVQFVAHLQSYLVQDGVAAFRVSWSANTIYLKTADGSYSGGPTSYTLDGAEAVSAIPDDLLNLIPVSQRTNIK